MSQFWAPSSLGSPLTTLPPHPSLTATSSVSLEQEVGE